MDRIADRDDLFVAVAHIARDLSHLPAAPTPDWCRRAAAVLTEHLPTTRAWVKVAAPAREAWPRQIEASGYREGGRAPTLPTPERLGLALLRAACRSGAGRESPAVLGATALIDAGDHSARGAGVIRQHPLVGVGVTALSCPDRAGDFPRLLAIFWEPTELREPGDLGLRRALASVLPVARDRLFQALGDQPNPWLSACEQRVLTMLTDGLSVPEIAEALGRSPHTIHDHVKRLHAKLGTRTRGALLARVLGHHPRPVNPVRNIRRARPIPPFRVGVFLDHRSW